MKAVLTLLVAFCAQMVSAQQCRQITVCNDDVISSIKGQKGEVGQIGKAGPRAEKGSKGETGLQGEPCALGSLGTEIIKKLTDLENLLNSSTTPSTTSTTTTPTTTTAEPAPISCSTSSVNGRQAVRSGEEIYCEDGWTVFQRRFNGSVDFQVNWNNYKNGFGILSGEFWLGFDKIRRLTSQGNCRLRIDLRAFDDDQAYAEYSAFSVDDESDNYRLHVTGYSGTAGDSLNYHNNQPFSTFDKDNDSHPNYNCATLWGPGSGGWWFTACLYSTLNGVWGRSGGLQQNIVWRHWKGTNEALKATTMKLRCD